MNGYNYANANPVNMTDPSGYIPVEIWAASFIAPDHITFPLPPIDFSARWEGDNRSWYNGEGGLPVSSRSAWWIRFDTCDSSTVESIPYIGETVVEYTPLHAPDPDSPFPPPESRIGRRTADLPDAATVTFVSEELTTGHTSESIEVNIHGATPNPIAVGSPAIEVSYEITFSITAGTISVERAVDPFPWHELWINVSGHQPLTYRQEPLGPTNTPFDLFRVPQVVSSTTKPFYDFSCQPPQPPSNTVPSPVSSLLDGFDIGCLFA